MEREDVGGIHVKYIHHCPRQLWLYVRGIRPEHLSGQVQLGEAVHETSYSRSKVIDLGAARLDHLDGALWVQEVKSSATSTKADQAQAIHYCYRLHQLGGPAQGAVLHCPKHAARCGSPTAPNTPRVPSRIWTLYLPRYRRLSHPSACSEPSAEGAASLITAGWTECPPPPEPTGSLPHAVSAAPPMPCKPLIDVLLYL
jgi:Domain of unknown function DUF83